MVTWARASAWCIEEGGIERELKGRRGWTGCVEDAELGDSQTSGPTARGMVGNHIMERNTGGADLGKSCVFRPVEPSLMEKRSNSWDLPVWISK